MENFTHKKFENNNLESNEITAVSLQCWWKLILSRLIDIYTLLTGEETTGQ